jgi:hypothetical protein
MPYFVFDTHSSGNFSLVYYEIYFLFMKILTFYILLRK